jgi:DNA repair protein RecO (recombination protein O)
MLHFTKIIVLKTVAYGDTSLIATGLTQAFGLQQYMVKGARKGSKNKSGTSTFLQPAAILHATVYKNDRKQIQMIKEMAWSHVYQNVMFSVRRNAVALFIVELIAKTIQQPEPNEGLFEQAEQSLLFADAGEDSSIANLPIYFAMKWASLLGLGVENSFGPDLPFLDLREGCFVANPPGHTLYVGQDESALAHQLLLQETPVTLYRIRSNRNQRRLLLQGLIGFFQHHVPGFGAIKSLEVMQSVLDL